MYPKHPIPAHGEETTMAMGNAERFTRLFNGEKVDRTPVIEWATWWDQTTQNLFNNGLSRINNEELCN